MLTPKAENHKVDYLYQNSSKFAIITQMEERLFSMNHIFKSVYTSIVETTGSPPTNPSRARNRMNDGHYLYTVLDRARLSVQRRAGTENWQPTKLPNENAHYYSPQQVQEILDEIKGNLDRQHQLVAIYRRIPLNEAILGLAKDKLLMETPEF
jgi:hypothetical protein